MTCFEIVSCIISVLAVIVSGFAALFTYRNLKEIRNQFFEQNRGNLIFYMYKNKSSITHYLILKNYGNSPARLLSLDISPKLDWSKSKTRLPLKSDMSSCKNVFLAPNQYISSEFDFRGYPDERFKITLIYETNGKQIQDSYDIDLNFSHFLVKSEPEINTELNALKAISNNIQQLSDKFL